MAASTAPHHASAPDAHLVTHSLAGDMTAFEELFRRHAHPAWRLALAVTGSRPEAAEAVADGFARTFQRAHRDGAPPASFRAALARATRQAALSRHSSPASDTTSGDDHDGMLAVFAGLPERWRSVLWLTDVEAGTAAQAGMVLALSPEATVALAGRARAGLRERFLDNARHATTNATCRRALDDLDAGDAHVSDCADCQAKVAVLADLKGALRPLVAVMPAGLGAAATARFQQWHTATTKRRRLALVGPVPAWAEKTLAGAAAAVVAFGIVGAVLHEGRTTRAPELAAPVGVPAPTEDNTTTINTETRLPEPQVLGVSVGSVPPSSPLRPGRPDGGAPTVTPASSTTPVAATPSAPTAPTTPTPTGPGPTAPEPSPPAAPVVGAGLSLDLAGTPVGVSVGADGVGVQVGDLVVGTPPAAPPEGQPAAGVIETGGLLPPIDLGGLVNAVLGPLLGG